MELTVVEFVVWLLLVVLVAVIVDVSMRLAQSHSLSLKRLIRSLSRLWQSFWQFLIPIPTSYGRLSSFQASRVTTPLPRPYPMSVADLGALPMPTTSYDTDTTPTPERPDPIIQLPTDDEYRKKLEGYSQFRNWLNRELELALNEYREDVYQNNDSVAAQDRHEEVLVLKRVRDMLTRCVPPPGG
jgi:hypothetical protein